MGQIFVAFSEYLKFNKFNEMLTAKTFSPKLILLKDFFRNIDIILDITNFPIQTDSTPQKSF